MSGNLSVEGLVIDDSFSNYCFQKNEADSLYWEKYLQVNPSEKEKIEEAKQLVLGLAAMLKLDEKGLEEIKGQPAKVIPFPIQKRKKNKRLLAISAAAVLVLLIGLRFYFSSNPVQPPSVIVKNTISQEDRIFVTGKGEKKMIVLPDSTKLYLNAGSNLSIGKNFGKTNRNVSLTGEALFDVTHDASLPFVVHMENYDVKVLGTLFNVKAYPGDKQSETSLISGKVEIQIAGNSEKIILAPNQKLIVDNKTVDLTNKDKHAKAKTMTMLLPLSYSRDNAVIETAWSQNRLEIIDESLADMKDKLERWYNVKINIWDREVSNYPFSATFEKETIQQVLEALKEAYHFNYEIKDGEITISK